MRKEEWNDRGDDSIDKWIAISYVHVCMYLILYPSPYTKGNILNYKGLDSFQNGWWRTTCSPWLEIPSMRTTPVADPGGFLGFHGNPL